MTISLILLIAAFVSFLLAMCNFPSRINLIGLGLALWVLTHVLGGMR